MTKGEEKKDDWLVEDSIAEGLPGSYDYQPVDSIPYASRPPELPDEKVAPEPPAAGEPAKAPVSVGKAVRSNAIWLMVSYGAMQLLRFGSNVIMTYLILPDMKGVIDIVFVFLTGFHLFSDVGVNLSIIQNKRGEDPDFYNTAWTVQVIRGAILWLASAVVAYPVSLYYETPELMWFLPIVGMNEFISGMDSTSMPTLRRRMERGRLVVLELATYIVSQSFTLVWLWYSPTIWAMVIGSNVSALFQMACSRFLIPGYRNRFCWDRSALNELLHYGKWIFLSTAATFFASQSDMLIVSAISLTDLGIYSVAARLATIPSSLMLTLSWQLIFPMYTRLLNAGTDLQTAFGRVHRLMGGFGAFMTTGILACGPALIRCAYDSKWHAASWMVTYLAVCAWIQILEMTNSIVLFAQGQSRAPAINNAVKVASLFVFVPIGYAWLEFPGILLAFVAADGVRYLMTVRSARGLGIRVLPLDLLLSLLIALCTFGVMAIESQLGDEMEWAARLNIAVRWVRFLWFCIDVVCVVIVWGILGLVAWRKGWIKLK